MKYKYRIGEWVYFMRDFGIGRDVSWGQIMDRFESQDKKYKSQMNLSHRNYNLPAYRIKIFKNLHYSTFSHGFVFDDALDDGTRTWLEYEFNIVKVAPIPFPANVDQILQDFF